MSAALPPVPDLIPISALRKGSSINNNNNCKIVRECAPCSSTQCSGEVEVMGEQRSRRTTQPAAAVETIDTPRSRGRDGAAPQPASRKTRTERHRKSDRRRDRDRERRKRSGSSKPCSTAPSSQTNPRVNPIFVWVRQRDTHIVEVKCEDYDKRNRILLTKTAQGWRAIPRTETLAPALQKSDEEKSRKVKKRNNSKVKRKSTAVQVDDEEFHDPTGKEATSPPPSPLEDASNENSAECSAQEENLPEEDTHSTVTPLDNLLAVAELEFNQQIEAERWENKDEDEHQINNMEQLDMFIESCATTPDESKSKQDDCECDYNEEDDNTIAMDDILSRLEQSLRSPDILHHEISDLIKQSHESEFQKMEIKPPEIKKKVIAENKSEESPTDLTTSKEKYAYEDDLMPTDLSVPKCTSPPKRPASQNSETIQSPQPSGIPAVPPSPDIYPNSANKKTNLFLESLLSPHKESNIPEKEPLDLGKTRESDSPKVTCSQEVQSPSEPPPKKIKFEDITLKTLLDTETKAKSSEAKTETPRLLELLTHEIDTDPIAQLKQVFSNATLNVPDPMLIPKDRLSQILSSPAHEIPKLLTERPELRLPEALAFPHLLQDPDILVITLAQLETIVQKQSQSLPLVEKEESEKKKSPVIAETPKVKQNKEEPLRNKKSKMSELSSDIDAATNAAFTQMMWLPYLNQLESAAMNFGSNQEFLKLLTTMLPGYPGAPPDMSHMMGRVPFPPPAFPMQPAMNYNPLELSMWQEAMIQANMARSKTNFDLFTNPKAMFPKNPIQNPYLNQIPISRPNLQIPQYNPQQQMAQKFSSNKTPNKPMHKNYDNFQKPYQQQKNYENEKLLLQQRQKQQDMIKQQEAYKQQELFAHKPKVACKPFANISQQEKRAPTRTAPGPMDLSGSTTAPASKLKVKQHLVDPNNAARLLKHDDVAEVGSTTASIEEMQDAQKHLWHPLFGNQKTYTSPWNWTTVTATGE